MEEGCYGGYQKEHSKQEEGFYEDLSHCLLGKSF